MGQTLPSLSPAQAEAAPRSRCQVRGRGHGSPRPLGSAPAAQWKFPSSLQAELAVGPGGGAAVGAIPQAAA